ncbi:GyrI-like domain-containing protein [Patescibacteria group bacterium]|nr:GyrI-like domain-containing protein [Patescibacteria group bacterium]
MKYEWRKSEKNIYLPKNKPEIIDLPKFNFFAIAGQGNPNDDFFGDYIKVLYSMSYGVRMSYKAGIEPKGFFEYTVYPLEGEWNITEEAKKKGIKKFNKNDLVFNLMIRQPEFVTNDFFKKLLGIMKKEKPLALLDKVKFEQIEDGKCIQMMHIGSYDDEPASFKLMEEFAKEQGSKRASRKHREIYITDARKVAPEKLKTVLRFKAK